MVVRSVQNILAALEQLVLRIHLFDRSRSVIPDEILGNHFIARLRHGEVGLNGHNQSEALQVRGGE